MQDVIYTILYIVKNFGNIFFRILSFFTVAKMGKSFKSIKSANAGSDPDRVPSCTGQTGFGFTTLFYFIL